MTAKHGIPDLFGAGGSGLSPDSPVVLRDVLRSLLESITAPTATTTTLGAIDDDNRSDGQLALVLDDNSFWRYDSDSAASAGANVVLPDDSPSTGRWIRIVPGTGASTVVGASVADITALKAISAVNRSDGEIVAVADTNALWQFNAASSATGDDLTVAQPAAGSGRWLRIDRANLGVSASVATLTALKAIPAAWRNNGQLAVVTTDGSKWRFVAASSLTGDDQLVAAPAAGSGRWIRADPWVDLQFAVTKDSTDAAVLYTVPAGFVLQLGVPFWHVTTSWSGGSSSAIGLSSSGGAMTTKGDLLGGSGGDVAAGLLSTGAYAKGTVGTGINKPGAVLVATDTILFDRIVDAFTAGVAVAHVPVHVVAAP